MSKATAVKKSKEAEAYLAKKLRPEQEQLKSPTSKLVINVSPVDKEGNDTTAHIGKFHIEGTELYSKTIRFRPIHVANKLIKMTKTKNKDGSDRWNYINETVMFTNYSDPIYDAKGGFACGKLMGAARKELTEAEAKANNEKAKSFMFLFGLAQFPGSKEWHFVDFRVGGRRIMECSLAFSSATIGKMHHISEFIYDMNLKATSKGVHPDLSLTVDVEDVQPVDEVIKYDTAINNYVDKHNERIMTLFNKYNKQQAVNSDDEYENLTIHDDE